jgi:hypothetical protein
VTKKGLSLSSSTLSVKTIGVKIAPQQLWWKRRYKQNLERKLMKCNDHRPYEIKFIQKKLSFFEGCLCYEPRDRLGSSVLKNKSLFRFDQAAKESHDLFERIANLLQRLHDEGHELDEEMYSNIEKLLAQPKERI